MERYPCYCKMGDEYLSVCDYCEKYACDYCTADKGPGTMCCKECLKVEITPYGTRDEAWNNDIGVYYYDAYRTKFPDRFK
jgi:hypothetical protein